MTTKPELEKVSNTQNDRASRDVITIPQSVCMENKDNLLINTALPGIVREDINIELRDNLLVIETEAIKTAESEAVILQEFNPRRYLRKFKISDKYDVNSMDASFSNGVLSMRIPLREENKAKKIQIN